MYNDIIMIVLCIFAVYGIYAFLREIFILLSHKYRVAVAIRVDREDKEIFDDIIAAQLYISTYGFLEKSPVLLCSADIAGELSRYGYDIYIKQTEEK